MNIDHFIKSALHVVASENIDISQDLKCSQSKNISELLINEAKEEPQKQKDEETSQN